MLSHIAAKVATDLKRMQRFYGKPSDERIAAYEAEATEFLKEGISRLCYLWLPPQWHLDRADFALHGPGSCRCIR